MSAGHDLQRGGLAVLVDRHQAAAVAVLPHNVGLRRKAVADMRHVAHVERGAVDGLHRHVVQPGDGAPAAVHLHVVFQRAQFDGSGGKNQVLRIDGVDDVEGRKIVGLQLRQVEVHLDLPDLSAVRVGRGAARDGGQEVPQKTFAQVEDLLLGQNLAAEAELNDRGGGGVIGNHQRGRGARRQAAHRDLGDGRDLRDGPLNVGPGTEEDLDDPQAVDRLRFGVLDVGDRDVDAALGVGDDAVGYILRGHAGIEPDHRDHRDVDLRKDVGGHAQDGDRRQDQDEQRHHHKRIGTPKG